MSQQLRRRRKMKKVPYLLLMMTCNSFWNIETTVVGMVAMGSSKNLLYPAPAAGK
jgi:hypothetical protein